MIATLASAGFHRSRDFFSRTRPLSAAFTVGDGHDTGGPHSLCMACSTALLTVGLKVSACSFLLSREQRYDETKFMSWNLPGACSTSAGCAGDSFRGRAAGSPRPHFWGAPTFHGIHGSVCSAFGNAGYERGRRASLANSFRGSGSAAALLGMFSAVLALVSSSRENRRGSLNRSKAFTTTLYNKDYVDDSMPRLSLARWLAVRTRSWKMWTSMPSTTVNGIAHGASASRRCSPTLSPATSVAMRSG